MESGNRQAPESLASRAELVNHAYASEPPGLFGTVLGAVVLAWVQAPLCGRATAWTWCASLVALASGRLWIRFRFRRRPVLPEEADRWAGIFRAGVLLSGLLWACAALLFFPEASPVHQFFTAFMVAGVVAGATAAYPPLPWAFPAFAVPVLSAILLRSLLSESSLHGAMTLMILGYCAVIAGVARSVRHSARSAIRLKFENQALLDHLEGTVARRTEELSRANQGLLDALEEKTRVEEERRRLEEQLQLARRMESLATLAGGVAHDFNNLLMGIGGQISLLLSSRSQNDPEAERLRAVERQVREGAELTRQLLGLSMGGKYEVRVLDPNALVRKVAALFARTHREIKVSTRLEEGVGAVEADRGQLEQALLNICLNAWQAMPGGGDLDVSTRRASVDQARASSFGAAPGDFVVIAVSDTGTGMDRSVLSRIFDPFFTTKEQGTGRGNGRSGAGLGLSSAYGILRNHGGFIEVDSERGRGSTFALFLPLSASSALADSSASDPSGEGDPDRHTVLVVEDEPMVAEVACLMLQRLGLQPLKALGGEAAMAHFRERGPSIDLVLLDMIMPGMNGEEVFRRLREMRPGVRVLLSSGYSREGRAQELIRAGCMGFLQKPYNLNDLRAKLEEILGPLTHAAREDAGEI